VPGWRAVAGLCGFALSAGVTAACTASGFADVSGWLPYRVLTVSWVASGFGVMTLGWWGERRDRAFPARAAAVGSAVLAVLAVALGLRGVGQDPFDPWASAGVVV